MYTVYIQYTVYTIYSIKYIYNIQYTIQSVDTFDWYCYLYPDQVYSYPSIYDYLVHNNKIYSIQYIEYIVYCVYIQNTVYILYSIQYIYGIQKNHFSVYFR